MNAYFPITTAIDHDANAIFDALNIHSQSIKKRIDSQSLMQRICIVAFDMIRIAAVLTTVSCLPVIAVLFTSTSLTIAAVSSLTAITSLAIFTLLDERIPGQTIIKKHWKALFESLRRGNGYEILHTCQELAKQKGLRSSSFNKCMGTLPPIEINYFFNKICLVGHLLIAIDHLRHGREDQALVKAHDALSYSETSGLSEEVTSFVKAIIHSPAKIRHLIDSNYAGECLHGLDYLIVLNHKASLPASI